MNHSMTQMRRWLKHGVAMVLFTSLMVGAGAAALFALAASISLLSKVQGQFQPTTSVTSAQASQGQRITNSSTPSTTAVPSLEIPPQDLPPFQQPVVSTSPRKDLISQLNRQLDAMHSPVGDALDSGGVLVGQTIEQTFGSVLSGILKTLFLEQNGIGNNAGGSITAGNGQR